MSDQIQTLEELATIPFARHIGREEAETLLGYIGGQGCAVSYDVQAMKRVGRLGEQGDSTPQMYNLLIDGSVRVPTPDLALLHFNFIPEKSKDGINFKALKFTRSPGSTLRNVQPVDRKGMEQVRTYVNNYFAENP